MGRSDVEAAVSSMGTLGLPPHFVKRVLSKAIKSYNSWEFIQAENYQLLAQLCFEELESETNAPTKPPRAAACPPSPGARAPEDLASTSRAKPERRPENAPSPHRPPPAPAPSPAPAPARPAPAPSSTSPETKPSSDKDSFRYGGFSAPVPLKIFDPSRPEEGEIPLGSFIPAGKRRSSKMTPYGDELLRPGSLENREMVCSEEIHTPEVKERVSLFSPSTGKAFVRKKRDYQALELIGNLYSDDENSG